MEKLELQQQLRLDCLRLATTFAAFKVEQGSTISERGVIEISEKYVEYVTNGVASKKKVEQ